METKLTKLTHQDDEFWFCLGLDTTRRIAAIAACSPDRHRCEIDGEERKQNPELPYDTFKVFLVGPKLGDQVDTWLKTQGLGRQQNRKIIRQLSTQLLKILEAGAKGIR